MFHSYTLTFLVAHVLWKMLASALEGSSSQCMIEFLPKSSEIMLPTVVSKKTIDKVT